MTVLLRSIFLFGVFLGLNVTLVAQELDPTVTVNVDALPSDQRQELLSMASVVKMYLQTNRYTNADWDGPRIPIDITIYVNSRNENRYTGRLSVVSKRLINNTPGTGGGLLRIFDQDWTFEWAFNPTLSYQPLRYDPFTSVIDFYMLLAIGLDMDTYDDLGGTNMYKVAQQIAQTGNAIGISQFSTVYQPGQFTRMSLVTEFNDQRYQGLRRLIFDYHDAVDQYAVNKDKGIHQIESVIHGIAEFKRTKISNRSVLLQAFFDAKTLELADIFRGYKGQEIWADLRFLDAGHTQQYEAARQGN
ncbi:MAG: DUF4835 family protein [Candidatus Kapabacteria bacterium]|nr:DUF4835 family protein [Candidatus Kapabacteria bacterium]